MNEGSDRTPLHPSLRLRFDRDDDPRSGQVVRRDTGEIVGYVLFCVRWGVCGWMTTGGDGRYWATANLAANALAGREVEAPIG